jgi:hypothetical protein
MVSLGWGVILDDLGDKINRINFMGGAYIAVSLVRDIMAVVAYTEVQKISQEEEDELFDIVSILTMVIALIDVMFYLWIIDSLNATMEYLEGMNQTSKLLRYLRLRMILLFSILFAVVWSVFGIVDNYDQGIVEEDQEWYVSFVQIQLPSAQHVIHTYDSLCSFPPLEQDPGCFHGAQLHFRSDRRGRSVAAYGERQGLCLCYATTIHESW